MAYAFKTSKGQTYYLHMKERELKDGRKTALYYFAKEVKAGSLNAVPDGYQVVESKNGLPVLKKKV